ncbi:unnamed protein product [Bathycoccus prasinos]
MEMQDDVFEGDTDEQLIVFDDDRPDDLLDDDDPGKYGEDAMPDDFFDQFVKHKIPVTRITNTNTNKKSSSLTSVNEGLLLPLRSVTSEQQPTTTLCEDREAKQQPENDINNDKIRIERLKKDAIEATETIRAVEEALRDALDWPLRGDSNRMCSRTELIGLVKHLKSDVLESRENAMRARERLTTMKATTTASSFSGGDGGIPSKVSINNFAVQLERVNREKDALERERKRAEYENRKYRQVVEQMRETKRDCEIALRKTLARLQKYERAFDAADMKNRELRDRIQSISRRLVESETKVGDAKMQVDVAEKRTQRAIQEMERAKSVATTRTDRAQSAELRAKQAIEDAKEKKKERDELFRETRALEKKCLDLATNNNYGGRNNNGRSHTNEHSRTIAELSALSQELAREEMMTRKRCEDVEKERDVLRLELVSVQAELKAMKEEISRAHERDINYVMSSSGGKGLTYHHEQYPPPPPPPPTTTTLQQQQQQTEMTGAGVEEATPGFGFFQTTTQPATGRVLQFEREDVPQPSESIASLEKDPAILATETTTKLTMTPRAEKQKNLALLKELAETRRMIKEERAMRLQAEQKLAT